MQFSFVGFLCIFLLTLEVSAHNIGLLIVATGKYISFVPNLIDSAEEYFCKGHKVTYFVFTDGELPFRENVVVIPQKRLGWPYDTLMRYEVYRKNKGLLASQDYLYACDADMLFCDDVGDEILGNLVATMHPGFYKKRGSYETNIVSTACVYANEGKVYVAGGFYGGTTKRVLQMFDEIMENILTDLKKGIIAVWHDESHWNRYCIDHPPTIILSPAYCYYFSPENPLPFSPRLKALDKNHGEIRS